MLVVLLMFLSRGTDFLASSGLGVWILGLCLVLVLVGAVAMIVNWRCPRCGKYLGRVTSTTTLALPDAGLSRCPHCGARLG